tara:strand:+ start:328 stop:636 length:309 start_codon:yes stop_codon:yes gene_type:complete
MATDPDDTGSLKMDVGRRLARTRIALGYKQIDFAERAGLSQPQYNQYERGTRLLSVQAARKIRAAYRLPLDWIYEGDPSGLSDVIFRKIRENDISVNGQSDL